MNEDSNDAPLSRRVPGSTRSAPSQPVRPVFSDTDVHRIQAAINAEQANAEAPSQPEPSTEPLPRVSVSGPETKQAGTIGRAAKPQRGTKAPRVEETLRAAKALQASAELRAAEKPRTGMSRGTEEARSATGRLRPEEPVPAPEPVVAPEPVPMPEPIRAEEPVVAPEPVRPPELARTPEPVVAPQPVIAAEPERLPEPRTAWPRGEPPPGTIGWLWPEGTATPRGGGLRWQLRGRWMGSGRLRYRTAALVALGVVVLAAGGLVLGMLLQSSPVSTGVHAATSDPKPSTHAPATTPKKHATKPAHGGGSAASSSPAPRARNHNVEARIRSGRQLLDGGRVSASAAAKSDLLAGAVDSRLLLVITAISNVEPVDVLGFADPGPGPGAPFLQMTLAETDPAASVSAPLYRQQLIALLQAHGTFPAVHANQVALPDGQQAIQVDYAAPSPLTG
jgi:hypothetical protein